MSKKNDSMQSVFGLAQFSLEATQKLIEAQFAALREVFAESQSQAKALAAVKEPAQALAISQKSLSKYQEILTRQSQLFAKHAAQLQGEISSKLKSAVPSMPDLVEKTRESFQQPSKAFVKNAESMMGEAAAGIAEKARAMMNPETMVAAAQKAQEQARAMMNPETMVAAAQKAQEQVESTVREMQKVAEANVKRLSDAAFKVSPAMKNTADALEAMSRTTAKKPSRAKTPAAKTPAPKAAAKPAAKPVAKAKPAAAKKPAARK